MYKMSKLNGNIYIALARYIFPTLKKCLCQLKVLFHFIFKKYMTGFMSVYVAVQLCILMFTLRS
jgi:hypothetical protein